MMDCVYSDDAFSPSFLIDTEDLPEMSFLKFKQLDTHNQLLSWKDA